MYFEKLTRKRDTLIQSIRMSESQPEIFNEVSNSRVTSVIIGASNPKQIEIDCEAIHAKPFTEEELQEINQIIAE